MSVLNYSFRIITAKTVHSNAFSMLEIMQLLHTTIQYNTESIFELTSKIYEGESNENLKSATKVLNTARLSSKFDNSDTHGLKSG
jgi:hypothetical protein